MKKLYITILVAAIFGCSAFAQDVDSLALQHVATPVDSLYLGRSIFDMMPSTSRGDMASVTIRQSPVVRGAMNRRIADNSVSTISGYRVRIFFSNGQTAREGSAAVAQRFSANYPGYAVYRSFVSPNFKVTVGDFRTKSEAMRLLSAVKRDFPAAFIVKEDIRLLY